MNLWEDLSSTPSWDRANRRTALEAADPGRVAQDLFEWSEKLVGMEGAVCFVVDGGELVPRFVFELPRHLTTGVRLSLDDDGVIQSALRHGRTRVIEGAIEVRHGLRLPWVTSVCIPLAIESVPVGVYLAGWSAPYEIGRETLLVLEGAASMAASAIHRAELLYHVKREEQRLRVLLDRLPIPAIGFSFPELVIDHVNAEARHLIGDVSGKSVWQALLEAGVTPLDGSPATEQSLAESLSRSRSTRIQLTTLRGSVRTLQTQIARLGSSGGVIMLVDVTAEANLEMQRRRFVRMVSHHLRTPLTPLTGYAELLTASDDADPLIAQAAADIAAAVTEMTAHVRRLEQIADLQPVDENELLVSPAVDLIAAAWKRAHGRDGDLTITGDQHAGVLSKPDYLTAAMAEVFTNAYAHGRPPVEVSVAVEDLDVVVAVRDGGGGIPTAWASAVFAPYLTGESGYVAPVSGRLGLGLTLARGLMEATLGRLDYTHGWFVFRVRGSFDPRVAPQDRFT